MADARDPLGDHMPHTPREPYQPDSWKTTCSKPSMDPPNKGCDQYNFCKLHALKTAMKGPAQLVVEDHRGQAQNEGRRFPQWCFSAHAKFFGKHPKAGFRICDDRVFYRFDGVKTPQGEKATQQGKWVAAMLAPYDEQGPYYRALPSQAPTADLAKQRDELIAEMRKKEEEKKQEATSSVGGTNRPSRRNVHAQS